ncbi:ArfGap-domain-containing protein [Trichodelitschia bisporula]|uniref:ADP-ribosylation factor GTPase-activating protein n=1 Tax=Trichodelitschia bisporula TaxID=703511 RepID=A0A6G1IBG9_9PEZI|nr:ArfGap-domain-containing protein [Trichodelitschia bisporula]
MGNIISKPGEGASALYLRDQTRFAVSALNVTTVRGRTLLTVSPNEYPASRYVARRDGDEAPVEFVQDPDGQGFLVRLTNDEELIFNFTFVLRQTNNYGGNDVSPVDTVINGLTFMFAPSPRELDNLITRELHADPNLHKNNPNVQLIGDYSTLGAPSVQFRWSWKWKPPRPMEDRGGGWRTCCSFVEYDQRNHRLDPLTTFSFWVQSASPASLHRRSINPKDTHRLSSPRLPSERLDILPKMRIPSSQSIESRVSDSDTADFREQPSPPMQPEDDLALVPIMTGTTKVDVACQRPGDDVSAVEDGPLFRATMKAMEQRTGNMRLRWKKVLRKAEAALEAQAAYNESMNGLMDALKEASSSNVHAVQPAIDHYFDKIAREILAYEHRNTSHLRKLIIDPISRLYNYDIKQAESKKRDFEEVSKEYYAFVSRYLGQRQDSMKEKKREETDSKYQKKRREFELKRFDYSSFMQDLHGGRKDQEVLSSLTKYADAQAKGFLATAKKIEQMLPQLEALNLGVQEADKEFQLHRTEREEKRRALEKTAPAYTEPETPVQQPPATPAQPNGTRPGMNGDPVRSASLAYRNAVNPSTSAPANGVNVSPAQSSQPTMLGGSPSQSNKFKGIRDLEEKDYSGPTEAAGHRKEGLVWALSRPGSHADPMGLNKQAWHKFWIVLDQGKLSEYTNWKQKLDLHMDPIDLRVASVREARNADRRFCFEIITPQFTRVYQATSEDDMKSWILTINNALQSAVEGKAPSPPPDQAPSGSLRKDIASVLTGKSASTSHRGSTHGASKAPARHATVGDRPHKFADGEAGHRLLRQLREVPGAQNSTCADCGSDAKVDWVSINLAVVICIECSGIHRSLGTHISKVRSLTLDPNAFTPDVVALLLATGNANANSIWEAALPRGSNVKPSPQANRDARLRFITAKYAQRAWVAPLSATLSAYSTPDDALLASIKKGDLWSVHHALALGGNPNALDRSRQTHAVFLALAAADPALPAGTGTGTGSSGRSTPPGITRKAEWGGGMDSRNSAAPSHPQNQYTNIVKKHLE